MDGSGTGGALASTTLPVRTAAPVRHADRIEFASKEWVEAARAYLAPRVAQRRDALRGARGAVCEIFTDAPPHLGYADNVAAFHIVVDDGELTVGTGVLDAADYSMRAASQGQVPGLRRRNEKRPRDSPRRQHRFPG